MCITKVRRTGASAAQAGCATERQIAAERRRGSGSAGSGVASRERPVLRAVASPLIAPDSSRNPPCRAPQTWLSLSRGGVLVGRSDEDRAGVAGVVASAKAWCRDARPSVKGGSRGSPLAGREAGQALCTAAGNASSRKVCLVVGGAEPSAIASGSFTASLLDLQTRQPTQPAAGQHLSSTQHTRWAQKTVPLGLAYQALDDAS